MAFFRGKKEIDSIYDKRMKNALQKGVNLRGKNIKLSTWVLKVTLLLNAEYKLTQNHSKEHFDLSFCHSKNDKAT